MENSVNYSQSTIAEMSGGIILANFERPIVVNEMSYQTEAELENSFIDDLVRQGYERLSITTMEELYANLKFQMERLNGVIFSPSEWQRFLLEYLDAPNDTLVEKTRKIQENHIYDFTFDDGTVKNIKIIDKKNINNNSLQVVNQIKNRGSHKNRYDVTILVNGLPLVHVELKKRGVSMREAFNEIHRYSVESFNSEGSLYKYVQIFAISNGTRTKYFANTTARNKNNYEFTCEWADARNKTINDLRDFTGTFFEKRTILMILTNYCVFDVNDNLLIMRPYQIAATERIIWKIKSSYNDKKSGSIAAGGYIWHTTGSGKTLTSFKTARLATELPFIDKVFFVVDRKDLDAQTKAEYERFQKDSVSASVSTNALKKNLESKDDRIVVTTIQKLNEFVKRNKNHEIYSKHCVLIFDECHRSQFGEAQKNIKKLFKNYYQFGFTGTPIFTENAVGTDTTAGVFGPMLHSYVITDAIRDEKVLKFKVDYNNVKAEFKDAETTIDEKELLRVEKTQLLNPRRIEEITRHILRVFNTKTHRNEIYNLKEKRVNGFNAMFAVESITAAKLYYEEFKRQLSEIPEEKRLRVGLIYSFNPNSECEIPDLEEETTDISALKASDKQFLEYAINDYNKAFKTNFSLEGKSFDDYYTNLSKRIKDKEVDLVIVVGMFLTGFDAPCLNTLFVDKNLRYHGLIQAFSRTNRILNSVKAFGNIVCFRDLEKATENAIKLFGDENSLNVIIERSFKDYYNGYTDDNGKEKSGYVEICDKLLEEFPEDIYEILNSEKMMKEFAATFGEFLKAENILRNFDEFENADKILSPRMIQDMKSIYVEINERRVKERTSSNSPSVDFSEIEFQVELLRTDEINLDYILKLILEKANERNDKDYIREEIRRAIKSSIGTRAKESLVIEFIDNLDFNNDYELEDIIEKFYDFARTKKEESIYESIVSLNLKNNADRFIRRSIEKGFVNANGADLDNILPPTSRRMGMREKKKREVLENLQSLVEVYTGI